MNTLSKIWTKLKDQEYRKAFVASQIYISIPFQIRSLLKSRPGWTQATLAERTGMLQPRISGLMTPGKTRPNIETLRRVAEAFDCGLAVRFVPFSELARWSNDFDPETFSVPDFEHDTDLALDKEFADDPPEAGQTTSAPFLVEPKNTITDTKFSGDPPRKPVQVIGYDVRVPA